MKPFPVTALDGKGVCGVFVIAGSRVDHKSAQLYPKIIHERKRGGYGSADGDAGGFCAYALKRHRQRPRHKRYKRAYGYREQHQDGVGHVYAEVYVRISAGDMPEFVREHAFELFGRKLQNAVRNNDRAMTDGVSVDFIRILIIKLDFLTDFGVHFARGSMDFVEYLIYPRGLFVTRQLLDALFIPHIRFAQRR